MSLNTITISGNLTRDPEIRTLANGSNFATFTVAVNTRKKLPDGSWADVPSFFDCKGFDRVANYLIRCDLTKGSKVAVVGRMEQETYTDKKSGEQRKAWKLIADDVEPMAAKGGRAGTGEPVTATYEEPGTYADEPLPF